MINNKIVLAVLFTLVFTYNDFGQNKDNAFTKSYELSGEEIFNEEFDIMLVDAIDTFIFAKLRSNDYNFRIYNSKTLNKIVNIAPIGESGNNFTNGLQYFGQYEKIHDQLYIWLCDKNRNKLYRINITKSIKDSKTCIDKEIKYLPECMFSQVYFLDSATIIGQPSNLAIKMNRFQIYNPQLEKIVKTVSLFPKVNNDNQDLNFIFYRYNRLYNCGFMMKPDKTKFGSAMNMFNRVDIFDKDGNIKNSYIDEDDIPGYIIKTYLSAKQENIKKVNVKDYYMAAFATNSFFYTLYYNQLQSDYPEKSVPVKIRIFNWNAEPVCILKVPDYLQYFSIDEKNGIMYGVAYFDEKILKYDISSILDEIKTDSK
jgi:hypothetical protein